MKVKIQRGEDRKKSEFLKNLWIVPMVRRLLTQKIYIAQNYSYELLTLPRTQSASALHFRRNFRVFSADK